MYVVKRDYIPRRSPKHTTTSYPTNYGDRENNTGHADILRRFLHSESDVWEIMYDTTTHFPYSVAASFTKARNRIGLAGSIIIAVRGTSVYLGRPGHATTPPVAPPAYNAADRARTRRDIVRTLIEFAESGAEQAIVTIPGDQTALYHALHYQRGRLALSITIARDGERIVLRRRG
jgi:hypothetical protein